MAVQYKDYYETLGVSKSASQDEIRKAFRKLARQHHPDLAKQKHKKAAEAKFKEINEAYEVLGDPAKREKYDTLGADWERGGPPPGYGFRGFPGGTPPEGGFRSENGGTEFHFGGTGFSDFFEAFFGGGGSGRGGGGKFESFGFDKGMRTPQRGHDVEADIMVTLHEALNGSRRQISLRREGSDRVETYDVKIPAGVRQGQKIRLAGQGGAGAVGGAAGDLYLRVNLQQHPDFRVEDSDLIHELTLAPWQCVLGTSRTIPTMEGSARLKIPPGTQPGRRFRLKGKGMSKAGGERGDLYAVVQVEIPSDLTPAQKALWQKLATT
jgi:curved DNA-binding protein